MRHPQLLQFLNFSKKNPKTMKTIFTNLFILLALFINAQTYTGTISFDTPAPGTTVTVNFSLVPPGASISNLSIYVYNSSTSTYSILSTTSTFNSLAYYAYFTIPANTPNNTVMQFALGTITTPATYYGTVASATVLPIILKSFTALLQGTDKVALQWELANNNHPLNKSIVYRSTDGINFNVLDTVMGATNQFVYNYTDLLTTNNNSFFYKIACLGIDGDKTISNTLAINNNGDGFNSVKILNNANVSNQLFLSGIDLSKYKFSDINMVDILGRKYQATIINNNTLNLNYLKAGMYYLKIGNNQPVNFIAQ